MNKTPLFLVLAWLLCTAACTGCSYDEVDAGIVLQRGIPTEPESLDLHKARSTQALEVLRDISEGLIAYSSTGEPVPAAAERWDVSDDGLTYTFYLRPDLRWSNGDAVIAEHFVFALRRLVAPETGAFYANLIDALVNAPEIVAGDLDPEALGVEAKDERTLLVRLTRPTPYIIGLFTHPSTFPLNPASLEEHDDRFARPGNLLSNGAFVLDAWVPGSVIALRENAHYWDNANTALDGVNYHIVVQDSAELNRYRAGELHVTSTVPSENFAELRKQFGSELRTAPYLGLYYYGFNLTKPPFKDNVALRQALSMAIDRELLAEKVIGRGEAPAYSWVPPGVQNYEPTVLSFAALTREERIKVARRLYKEAGYSEQKPLRFEVRYNTAEIHRKVAVAAQSMWKEALGAEATLVNEEYQVLLANMRNADVTQVFRAAWIGDYVDAHSFLSVLQAGSAANTPRYANDDYETLMQRAAEQTDLSRRALYLEEAERVMLADHPVIPVYFYVSKHLISPKVRGWEDNVLDYHYSHHLSLSATD